MSKDIRSFFKIDSKKKTESTSSVKLSSASKRKANSLNSSDDEKETSKSKEPKKPRRIIDSDDEEKPKKSSARSQSKPKSADKKKVVEVDVLSMFGSEPIKRKDRPKVVQPLNISSDPIVLDDDDETLAYDLSLIADIEKQESLKKSSPLKRRVTPSKSPRKKEVETESKSPVKRVLSPKKEKLAVKEEKVSPPLKKPKLAEPTSSKKEKKPKELKPSTVEEDEARHERKQVATMMYHKFKNRSTVINHGCKEIPKGKPSCLKGCQFVISGVLESMEREEAVDVIKSCGGNVVTGLSKKVTHLLVGEEAGLSKLAKADEMKILTVTEDELFDLIRKKSGLPVSSPPVKQEIKEEIKNSPGKENRVENDESLIKKEVVKSPVPEKKKPDSQPKVAPDSAAVSTPTNMDDLSFVDKYKPTSIKQIIGQQGANGHAQKLMNWLTKWHTNHDGKTKHAKPNPWAKDNDGRAFKAALLSGSPGVGKTTTAHLVCADLMFDIVEFNASDTRSKRLLKEEVSSLLSNNSLAGYLNGTETKVSKRHVLIMDEVDGMAGNEDRGGVAELIALIKDSRVPVICMCNDRNHPKIRSLANHCFDLRFTKPSVNQIRGAMMSVCFKEGIKLEAGAMDEIISGTGNDIRQTLNHLALYSATKDVKLVTTDAKKNAQMSEKDIKIGQFESIRKVFSAEEHKTMTFTDKCDLFFNDYNMAPLFVQENYLHVKPNCAKSKVLERVALAADSLSLGDLVEKKIRSSMAWSLLPTQAIFSSVLPGEYMEGSFKSAVNFPGWLGKTSRSNKRKRLAQEVHDHTRMSTSGSRLSVRLDYAPFLIKKIVNPLKEKGNEGVPEALEVIKEYRLLREDIDALLELTTWSKMKNPWDTVDSKVKAALTRAYNKEIQPYSYSAQAGIKKKAGKSSDSEELEGFGNEDEATGPASDEDEDDDSVENNALIKVKKPAAAKASKAGTSNAESTSKAGTSSRAGSSSKAGTSSKASSSKAAKPKGKK